MIAAALKGRVGEHLRHLVVIELEQKTVTANGGDPRVEVRTVYVQRKLDQAESMKLA